MSKSAPVDLSAQLAELGGVSESLGEMLASQEDTDRFFADVLGKFDGILVEFTREQQRWQADCAQRETALAERAEALDRQRAELEALRLALVEDVRRAHVDAAPAAGETGPVDAALRQTLDEARREQAVLEAELEAVRTRAAELTELLASQKHEAAEQRAQWMDELRRQRLLLESLVHSLTQRAAAPGPPASAETEPPRDVQAADSALESVMAQFEMLQRDVARRRSKAETGS